MKKEKVKLPKDVAETCITLCRFAVLCQVLFRGTGPTHPLVDAMWTTALGLQNFVPVITDRYQALICTPRVAQTYFARIVQAVQLGVYKYLQGVALNIAESAVGVEEPNFLLILQQDLKRGTFHPSTNRIPIPAEYMSVVAPQTTSTASGTGTPLSSTISGVTGRSAVSLITNAVQKRDSVARIENPAPDNEFASLALRSGGTRTILGAHQPPADDAGNEFCVAWWTRSVC